MRRAQGACAIKILDSSLHPQGCRILTCRPKFAGLTKGKKPQLHAIYNSVLLGLSRVYRVSLGSQNIPSPKIGLSRSALSDSDSQ